MSNFETVIAVKVNGKKTINKISKENRGIVQTDRQYYKRVTSYYFVTCSETYQKSKQKSIPAFINHFDDDDTVFGQRI